MRTFQHFNQQGKDVCPICGTNEDKETVLVPIVGSQVGNNVQAIQVHLDCIGNEWWYYPVAKIVAVTANVKPNPDKNYVQLKNATTEETKAS